MQLPELIESRVAHWYKGEGLSCVHTTLKILAELYAVELNPQVYDCSSGMGGGIGHYGAQCGLVEGAVMFIGILGRQRNWDKDAIGETAFAFASEFEKEFQSLICRDLRPEAFAEDNPPHLCEPLTVKTVTFTTAFLSKHFKLTPDLSG